MAKTETVATQAVPEMEYVEIPSHDLFDKPFDGIWNNHTHYAPGVHLVEKVEASYLRERLKIWQAEQIRQLRPNADPRVAAALKPNAT
jgi:hypothetical protein